jgi:hypothetical protein
MALAGLVGAGVGAAALRELLEDFAAAAHRDEFAAALDAGAALLWVRCTDPERERLAVRILKEAGGRYLHINERSRRAAPGG